MSAWLELWPLAGAALVVWVSVLVRIWWKGGGL